MTFNVSHRYEQEQRIAATKSAVEAQIDKETDLHSAGRFDGLTGGKPEQELWKNLSYRSGYLFGVGQYYDKKFETVFDEPF